MNKRIKAGMTVALLFLLSGCQQEKSTMEEEVPKEVAAFTWAADRTKHFGEDDYPLEAETLESELSDRFQVELLPLYHELEAVVQEDFSIPETTKTLDETRIKSLENELMVLRSIGFSKEDSEEEVLIGNLTVTYKYYPSLEKVKVTSHRLQIENWTGDETFYGQSMEKTVRRLGEILKVEDLDEKMADFEKAIAEEDERAGQTISLYKEEAADHLFTRSIAVEFDEAGVAQKIYAFATDRRE